MSRGTEGAGVGPGGHAAFLSAGLIATAAQVLLLRELVVDVAGDETAIGVGLAAWLLGIAAGAALARRRDARVAARDAGTSARDAGPGLAALAVLPPLAIVAGRVLRRVLSPDAGELPGLGVTILLGLATLLPCGAAVGWVFTTLASAAARIWRGGEAVARLYVVESLGSLAGGVVVTLLAGRLLPLRLCALIGFVAALVALGDGLRRPLLAAAALSAGLAAAAGPLDAASERARFAGMAPGVPLLASVDTPYQHLTVGGDDVVRHLYASGQYVGSFPDPYTAESTGHLVALLAARPERVLLLGGVERGLVPVLLRHPVRELVIVEPDRQALAFLLPQLPPAERAALGDPRVRIVHDDARHFLSRPRAGRFDLVLALGPDPATLLRARLATVEFFRMAAGHLSPEGVLVVRLPAAPAVLTGASEALAGSLVRSLREALPVVRASLPAEALAIAGTSAAAVTLDPVELARRWQARGIASDSFASALLPVLLPPEGVAAHGAALAAAAGRAAASRDDRPISFLHALVRRQRVVSGASAGLVRRLTATPAWLLALLAFVPSLLVAGRLLGRPSPGARPGLVASHGLAVTGAASLGWSLLVLFSFQTHAGALYGRLGALVAVFMLGLALGAAVVGRAAAREIAGMGPAARRLARSLAAAAAFGAVLPLALAGVAHASTAGAVVALTLHGALLLAAGLVTGAVFPAASEVRIAAGDPAGQAAGRLATAEHVGAAVAGLAGPVVFVPLLGLTRSGIVIAGLLALALVLALLAVRGRDEPGRDGNARPTGCRGAQGAPGESAGLHS